MYLKCIVRYFPAEVGVVISEEKSLQIFVLCITEHEDDDDDNGDDGDHHHHQWVQVGYELCMLTIRPKVLRLGTLASVQNNFVIISNSSIVISSSNSSSSSNTSISIIHIISKCHYLFICFNFTRNQLQFQFSIVLTPIFEE